MMEMLQVQVLYLAIGKEMHIIIDKVRDPSYKETRTQLSHQNWWRIWNQIFNYLDEPIGLNIRLQIKRQIWESIWNQGK